MAASTRIFRGEATSSGPPGTNSYESNGLRGVGASSVRVRGAGRAIKEYEDHFRSAVRPLRGTVPSAARRPHSDGFQSP